MLKLKSIKFILSNHLFSPSHSAMKCPLIAAFVLFQVYGDGLGGFYNIKNEEYLFTS